MGPDSDVHEILEKGVIDAGHRHPCIRLWWKERPVHAGGPRWRCQRERGPLSRCFVVLFLDGASGTVRWPIGGRQYAASGDAAGNSPQHLERFADGFCFA